MKKKALFRTIVLCLLGFTLMIGGCAGKTDHPAQPVPRNGATVSSENYHHRIKPGSDTGLRGTGMNGINPDGSGTSDSRPIPDQDDDIGNQGFQRLSIAGRTPAAGNGNEMVDGAVEYLRPLGINDVLVLGDIVLVTVDNPQAANGRPAVRQADNTRMQQYFGEHTLVLKVTGPKAAKALRRVRETIDSGNALINADSVMKDMRFLMQQASP